MIIAWSFPDAEEFSVDYYDGGYALITVMEDGQFLVVPEGKKAPKGLDKNITVIQKPVNNIYLVATSAMNLFCALDSLDHISLSGTDAEGWHIEKAKKALEDGSISFAGKYSAPDYELILSKNCGLAIESTMTLSYAGGKRKTGAVWHSSACGTVQL